MEMHVGVFFEPALVLFVGIEVVQDDVKLAARKGRNDAVHEAEKFDATPAPGMRGKDLSGGNLECGKQRRRAVALVIVALAGERPPVGEFQIALRPFQRLNGRLLIDAENNRPGRRFHIKADDVGSFLRKIRVVAFAPGFARRQIDLVVTQATPDILDVDIAQCPGQKRPCPAPEPRRWRLVQQLQYPFVRRRRVERLFARTWLILQPRKPMIGVAMPPTADNPRLNANLFGNRPRTPALRSQQNNPRALQVALHRPRRTATSFQLLAIATPQSHFSCFGNHPDLESRLTIYEKRVLDQSGAERRMAGGIGAKKVDVTWATEESGLLFAISIKTINYKDTKTGNFQKNLTNRRGDMLIEAVTLHRRFPYAVLAGFFFLDKGAETDGTKKRNSTFTNAHHRVKLFTGRPDPAGRDEQFERLYIFLMDASPEKAVVRAFSIGEMKKQIPLSDVFDDLVRLVAERNPDFYEEVDGKLVSV